MDENINLAKILKDCPKDWSLYSPVCGYVHFVEISAYDNIIVVDRSGNTLRFMSNGMYRQNGECLLFPSYSNRDWSNFKLKTPKFDPKTLQPFAKVLVYDIYDICEGWACTLFSHIRESEYPYSTSSGSFKNCIPYNDDTKHLVGTTDEAPEYYRYWED